jgi:hypothetical protein
VAVSSSHREEKSTFDIQTSIDPGVKLMSNAAIQSEIQPGSWSIMHGEPRSNLY